MDTSTTIFAIVVNLPIFLIVGWGIFGSWSAFLEDLGGDGSRIYDLPTIGNNWRKLKLAFFVIACVTILAIEYKYFRA